MNKYELMYIIDVALEDAPRKELIDRVNTLIADNGGEVEKIDEWGKRRLAYTIDYKNEGYYVLVNFSAVPELPKEIERVLQISEDVLRYLIVRLEEKHTSVKPKPVPVRPAFARPAFSQAEAAPMAEAAPLANQEAPDVEAAPAVDAAPETEAPEAAPETPAQQAETAPEA